MSMNPMILRIFNQFVGFLMNSLMFTSNWNSYTNKFWLSKTETSTHWFSKQ